jgi:ankyrin repeat protein
LQHLVETTTLISLLSLEKLINDVRDALWGAPPERIRGDSFSADPAVKRLAVAVEHGDPLAITTAVQAGADVNAVGRHGCRLLYWALARGNPVGFEGLLERGADINAPVCDPSQATQGVRIVTVLEKALASEDPAFITAALRQGLDPDYVPFPGPFDSRSLLFFAVQASSIPVAAALLDHGADIAHTCVAGYTPLIEARMGRDYNMAWFLLNRGADPTIKDKSGHDFVWGLKQYGTAGVWTGHEKSFEAIVAELVKRGLLTHQDIIEADKPKPVPPGFEGSPPGITVIEHAPDSEAGQAILELDRLEREATERARR